MHLTQKLLIDGIQQQIFEYQQNRHVFLSCRSFFHFCFLCNQQEHSTAAHHSSIKKKIKKHSEQDK